MSATVASDEQVKATARDWLLRLSLDEPTQDERAQCAAWREQDPRHETAYRRFERIWQDCTSLKDLAPLAPAGNEVFPRKRVARGVWLPVSAALAASVLIAVVVLRAEIAAYLFSVSSGTYTTDTAQLRELRLADGSQLTLGARSSVELDFTDTERRIVLSAGEAFFTVARDASRPFTVFVDDKKVRALGTRFEVRRSADTLRVAVSEGVVELSQANSRRVVQAGQQAVTSLPEEQDIRVGKIDASQAGAWRSGRLAYVDTPLREVIADATRYSDRHIEFADEATANLQVSVTFAAGQVEEMVMGLARALPIEIVRPAPDRILIRSVDSTASSVSTP